MSDIIYHKHHLLPTHDGGTDDPHNIVKVNIPLHIMLHKIRWQELGQWQDEIAYKALSGQIDSQEILAMANAARRGIPLSEETRKKISNKLKGRKRPRQSQQMKNQEYRRKTYEVIYPNGNVEVVIGLVEFCKKNNINAANLCQVAKGKKTHANGFRCKEIINGC